MGRQVGFRAQLCVSQEEQYGLSELDAQNYRIVVRIGGRFRCVRRIQYLDTNGGIDQERVPSNHAFTRYLQGVQNVHVILVEACTERLSIVYYPMHLRFAQDGRYTSQVIAVRMRNYYCIDTVDPEAPQVG
jgi:hypothetical protein